MGRKKLGNVLFARRVKPEKVAELLKVIGCVGEGYEPCKAPVEEVVVKAQAQTKELLDSIDGLTKEVEFWKARFEKAVVATEHQMAVYWKDRALKAEKRASDLENMQ